MRKELDLLGAVDGDDSFRMGVRDFAKKMDLERVAKEADETGVMPEDVLQAAKDAGYFGIIIPEEYGGVGGSMTEYCLMIEELGRKLIPLCNILAVHNGLSQTPIILAGTEEQKRKYLPGMATGEDIGAFAITEPNAGVNINDTRTKAVKKGDLWVLNGSKMFITNGPIAKTLVTLTRAFDENDEDLGLTTFIIQSDYKGFSVGQEISKMGLNSVPTSELVYDDMEVPGENLLGQPGKGMDLAFAALSKGRLAISAGCTGVGREALELATRYALQRHSGRKHLAKLATIQHKIAEMARKVYAMGALTYHTAGVFDSGRSVGNLSDLAKVFSSENALDVINEAIQVYGGYGYTKDFPLERMLRETRVCPLYEGTNEVLERLAARHIFYDMLGMTPE